MVHIKKQRNYIKLLLKIIINWLGHYGYNVSSEWMIPKIMEVMNRAPEIMEKTAYIMEAGDWIVNKLTNKNVRSIVD